MKFTLSSWSIKNPIPPIVIFLILTVYGIFSYIALPINNLPNIKIPIISVIISQPGATPNEIESQITRKVESVIGGIEGIKQINSTISSGYSNTTAEFHLHIDVDRALYDVKDAIDSIRSVLPQSILEPSIQRLSIENGEILAYSVEAPNMTQSELSWYIDDTINKELLSITGVARVERFGGVEQEFTVIINPSKLVAHKLTISEINRQLMANNGNLPGGNIKIHDKEYLIRTNSNVTNIQNLGKLRISTSQNQTIKLEDIATIKEGTLTPNSISKLNGKPVVNFAVFRNADASEVTIAKQVERILHELQAKSPNLKFTELFSLVDFTKKTFKSTLYTFIEGAILTVIVVFFFLRDRRSTIIAALAIPLSIIPTFIVMNWIGFTLNGVTMLAISLVTGVLVDDAIVEIENINRYIRNTGNPYKASIDATNEIGLAVVATTLVICAVFAPVSFMNGISGQYFKQFGLTVCVATLFSLLVARIIIPMLSAYLLKPTASHDHQDSHISYIYIKMVTWTLSNRRKTLLIAGCTMLISFAMIPFLNVGFLPYEDYSQAKLLIELPRGTSIEETDRIAQEIASIIREKKEVIYVLSRVSNINKNANKARLIIKLAPPNKRELDQKEFENLLLEELNKIPDMRVSFSNIAGMKDLYITLMSDNVEALTRSARELQQQMSNITGFSSVASSEDTKQPEIVINIDFDKAARLGISSSEISDNLRIATIGSTESNLPKFNYDNRQIPIRILIPNTSYPDLSIIENMQFNSKFGESISLKAFANIYFSEGPSLIKRYNKKRNITIEANLDNLALGEAMSAIMKLPAIKHLPPNVKLEQIGDAQAMNELFSEFSRAICTGLFLVYTIQVLLYKNWLQPLTRMAALPLSIGGTFIALLITNVELGLPAIIGILMLMGIADKNSILLVDYILELIKRGQDKNTAIIEGCLTRARPIIMTSVAMLAGMLPIALGTTTDSAFRAPMAIAVIGGLISSTALSLIFVPVLFSYVYDIEQRLGKALAKFR
jgi:hydrophobe/amphiphile efflux-1 (HAE1) family protein